MAISIDARGARRIHSPRVRSLAVAGPRKLDARLDRHLSSPTPTRLPRDTGKGSFMPGLGLELDETEVQVGFESPDQLASDLAGPSEIFTKTNVMALAGAALVGYLLFKR